MKRINVLVTAVGGPTALGIIKCLKDVEYINIIGTDVQKYAAGSIFCDKFYCISPISDIESYKKEILEIVAYEEIDIIFPTLQDEIMIYQEFNKDLGTEVAIPLSDTPDLLIDKEKLYKFLEKKNLIEYVPKYYAFNNNAELLNIVEKYFNNEKYVCVKTVQGHGGLGFAILTDRKNYIEALYKGKDKVYDLQDYCEVNSSNRRLVMEYLDGIEYSVDILLHQNKVIAVLPRRRIRVSNGIVIDGTVENNKKIIDIASTIALIIAKNGFLNLQFIHSNNGYKLTDVNARFCGSQVMSYGAGVNFPLLYIKYNILNEYVPVNPKWNTRMVRYWESCFFYD